MKALLKKLFWIAACCLICGRPCLDACGMSSAEPAPAVYRQQESEEPGANALYAQCAVLMDGESGRILYEKNGSEIRPMASTTKIMTCILALESCGLEEVVEVSSYAASMPDVQLNIRQGERYRLGDLLYSLMLESHNDSAVAIAEHVSGTVEEFAGLMNEKARGLGCLDTWFITPNGLDAVQTVTDEAGNAAERAHSTTAADLARIMRYCVMESPQRETFLEITQTSSFQFSDLEGKRSFSCQNHNSFLTMYEGALSGKTGFTGQAGYCYVGAVRRDGKTVIAALLGSGWPPHKTYKWSDMKKLAAYGLEQFQLRTLDESLIDTSRFSEVPVAGAQTEEMGESMDIALVLSAGEGVERILMKDSESIQVMYEIPEQLKAPVNAGQKLGTIIYFLDGEEVRRYELTAPREIREITLRWWLEQVLKVFLP